MTTEQLIAEGAIYFSQLKTGLSQYRHKTVVMDGEQAYRFFLEKQQQEYPKKAYADFYYFSLPPEARQKAASVLGKEELLYLEGLGAGIGGQKGQQLFQKGSLMAPEAGKGEIIFPLEEKLLRAVTKLNQAEMLFSTIYFTGEKGRRSTWWGNYGREYLVFWEG